jgi:hypothetical protein
MVLTIYSIAGAICVLSGTWIVRAGWTRRFIGFEKPFEFAAVLIFLILGALTGHISELPGFTLIMSCGLAVRSVWSFCRAAYNTASLEFWYAISYLIIGMLGIMLLHHNCLAAVCLIFLQLIPINALNRIYLPNKGSRNDEDVRP